MPLPYTPYALASAAVASSSRNDSHAHDIEPVLVPTPHHPGLDSTPLPSTSIPAHHAVHAKAYFPSPSSGYGAGFVLARAVADARELELSWCRLAATASSSASGSSALISTSKAADDADCFAPSLDALPSGPPPRTFIFPAPLLPDIGIFADSLGGRLYVLAVTATGYLYRLTFSLPFLFHAASLGASWASEYRISHLAGFDTSGGAAAAKSRAATQAFMEDAGLVLLACGDGTVVKLQQSRSGTDGFEGSWRESVLRPTSFLSGVSRFFSRSASPADARSSPTHALSVTSFVGDNGYALAFAASRDRKLRIWNMVSETCVRTLDLPVAVDPSASAERQLVVATGDDGEARTSKDGLPPFSLDAKPLLKLFTPAEGDQSGYPKYLLAFVPAPLPHGNMFALYGIELEESRSSSGGIGEVNLLWQKRCDPETRSRGVELRDVAIAPLSEEAEEGWTMWTLWDAGDGPLLKYTRLGDEAPVGVDESSISINSGGSASSGDDWRTTSSERHFSPLHGEKFEELLEANKDEVDPADIILPRVLEPGRFSEPTLRAALKTYRNAVPSTSRQPSSLFQSLAEEVSTIVASNCELETDPKTGGQLHDKFYAAIVREWVRFIGLAEQIESSARWPVGLALPEIEAAGSTGAVSEPIVITRAALCVPFIEDAAGIVESLQRSGDRAKTAAAAKGSSTPALDRVLAERRLLMTAADSHAPDILPVLGSTSATVAEVFEVIDAASQLSNALTLSDVETFIDAIRSMLHAPLSFSLERAATDIWNATVADALEHTAVPVVERLVSTLGAGLDDALKDVVALLASADVKASEADPLRRSSQVTVTELGASISGDALSQAVATRHALAVPFAILVLALLTCSDSAAQLADVPLYVAHVLALLQSLDAIRELARTPGLAEMAIQPFDEGDRDSLAARLDRLSVVAAPLGRPTGQQPSRQFESPSLLHFCIAHQLLIVETAGARQLRSSLGRKIGSVVVHALGSSDLLVGSSMDPATPPMPMLTAGHARLCDAIVHRGFPSAALAFLSHFPPTPASHYLQARALVYLDRLEEASDAFERVVPAIESPIRLRRNKDGLVQLLPASVVGVEVKEPASQFYRHVSSFFEAAGSPIHVAKFCQAAIEASSQFAEGVSRGPDESSSRDLWFKVFRAQLDLEDFHEAYATIMALPHAGLQKDCLRSLVGVMCEAGEVATLLKFSFPGLQPEIERTLSFKARNSDTLSTPNYYFVLYSYHIFRGDLKSAGAVMYQHALRLRDAHRTGQAGHLTGGLVKTRPDLDPFENFMDVTVKQAQSYLASINALSMIKAENAWFAHAETAASEQDVDAAALVLGQNDRASVATQPRKPRDPSKLTSYIPASLFSRSAHEIRIVTLSDIRKEYALTLARLELVGRYPELGYATSTLRPSDAVLLFVNADRFDLAFSTAKSLDVDMTPIFANLAAKCVALARARGMRLRAREAVQSSRAEIEVQSLQDSDEDLEEPEARFLALSERSASWTGSASERAWRYLQMHLEMFDDEGACWKYRMVVLDKVVSLRLFEEAPSWLKEWFERQRPDAIVRALRRYGMVDESLRFCVKMVKKETADRLRHNQRASSSWLPYSLFDEILLQAEDPDTRPTEGSASATTTRGLAAELRQALQARIEALEKRTKEVKRQSEADLERDRKRRERERGEREMVPAA